MAIMETITPEEGQAPEIKETSTAEVGQDRTQETRGDFREQPTSFFYCYFFALRNVDLLIFVIVVVAVVVVFVAVDIVNLTLVVVCVVAWDIVDVVVFVKTLL